MIKELETEHEKYGFLGQSFDLRSSHNSVSFGRRN
jgi:hypothetical protein